jgi:hypothetical protein
MKASARSSEREQSSIGFPYMDLETGTSVARAVMSGGGVAVTRDQLAGLMDQPVNSGTFLMKVAASRLFGLITFSSSKYALSDLGFEILDSDERRQKTARARAFLSVPLYKKTYDEFKGKQLPPRPHGLEQAFRRFGVSSKQTTNARLAFDKSATQAGFFPNGPDRLIEPIIAMSADRARPTHESPDSSDTATPERGSTGHQNGLNPFIQGLLEALPEPQTNWTVEGRAKWLQAAANIFDLIYKGSGEIDIKAVSSPRQRVEE